jgi:hypothetical protein
VLEDRLAPAGNLITNGGFESPALPFARYQLFSSIPGWSLASGPAIEVQNHVAGAPAEGQQHVELDSSASSAIYQDVATVPGETYRLTFAFAARPGTDTTENHLQVTWGGTVIADLTADGTGQADTSWKYYSYDVINDTAAPTTRLQFADLGRSDSLGTYLDGVSLVALHGPVADYKVDAPAAVFPGQTFALTVTPVDAYGNPFPDGLTGLSFASSDGQATLPGFYSFSANNPSSSGAWTVPGFTLSTLGQQSIQLTDGGEVGISTSVSIRVHDHATIDAGSDTFANVDTPFVRQGHFATRERDLIVSVDYGDGSASERVASDQANSFTLSHTYQKEGSVLVTVTVSDVFGPLGTTAFYADVMLPGVVSAVKVTVQPGQTGTVDFAGASVTLQHSGASPIDAFVIVASVPESSLTTLPNTSSLTNGTEMVTSYDVRGINVSSDDVATVTFHYDATNNNFPTLTYYDETTRTLLPVSSTLYRVNTQDHTITLRLDGGSSPALFQTRGTVFSIAVPLSVSAPPALAPSLPEGSQGSSQVALTSATAADGGQDESSSEVTGGSQAASGGPGNGGGGGTPEYGGGAQESSVLADLPPPPGLAPVAVGTAAVPTIEPPPESPMDALDATPLSLEEPTAIPQAPAPAPAGGHESAPTEPTVSGEHQAQGEPASALPESQPPDRRTGQADTFQETSPTVHADAVFTRLAARIAPPEVLAGRSADLVLLAAFLAGAEPWKWPLPSPADRDRRAVRSSERAS